MTVIVGLVKDKTVWMGSDSAGIGGLSMSHRLDSKVFVNKQVLIGYTSSFRMGQILQYNLTPPKHDPVHSNMEYMVKTFIPSVRSMLKKHGFQKTVNGEISSGTFLVGYNGQLYQIEGDYQVCRVTESYQTCGCGGDIALGSLFSTESLNINPKKRIKIALSAAARFSAGVCKPFHIISQTSKDN